MDFDFDFSSSFDPTPTPHTTALSSFHHNDDTSATALPDLSQITKGTSDAVGGEEGGAHHDGPPPSSSGLDDSLCDFHFFDFGSTDDGSMFNEGESTATMTTKDPPDAPSPLLWGQQAQQQQPLHHHGQDHGDSKEYPHSQSPATEHSQQTSSLRTAEGTSASNLANNTDPFDFLTTKRNDPTTKEASPVGGVIGESTTGQAEVDDNPNASQVTAAPAAAETTTSSIPSASYNALQPPPKMVAGGIRPPMAPPSPLPPRHGAAFSSSLSEDCSSTTAMAMTPTRLSQPLLRQECSSRSRSQSRPQQQPPPSVAARAGPPRVSNEATKKIASLYQEVDHVLNETQWVRSRSSLSLTTVSHDAVLQQQVTKQQATLHTQSEEVLSAAANVLYETFDAVEILAPPAHLIQQLQLKAEPLPLLLEHQVISLLRELLEAAR